MEIIMLREHPEIGERLAAWFHEKWGIPEQAYLDSMDECLGGGDIPQWYAAMDGEFIMGGLGVI